MVLYDDNILCPPPPLGSYLQTSGTASCDALLSSSQHLGAGGVRSEPCVFLSSPGAAQWMCGPEPTPMLPQAN